MNENVPRLNRREALRIAAGGAAGCHCWLAQQCRAATADASPNARQALLGTQAVAHVGPDERRLILVLFGGGTRSSESIGDPEHRYIPHCGRKWSRGERFGRTCAVEGRVVHPNCNASIKTGHWEYDDLDWSKPPRHPTIFEIVRKRRNLPDTAAWAFVYASILAQTGQSSAEGYGPRFAANVVEPPTIPRTAAEEMERLMAAARATGSPQAEEDAAAECARLARTASRIAAGGLQSRRPAVGSTNSTRRGGKQPASPPATTPFSPGWLVSA